MQKFKGVTPKVKTAGGTIFLKWRDPRKDGKQQFHSTETTETQIAERIAAELSRVIYNKSEWSNPKGLHPRTEAIWNPVPNQVQKNVRSVMSATEKAILHTPNLSDKLAGELILKENEINLMLLSVQSITQERDALQEENTRLKDQLRRMGVKAIKNARAKPIKEAIVEFFKSGASTATGNWKYALTQWFERFARDFADGQDVKTITPEEVAAHIHRQDCAFDTKRRLKINLAKFLRHATSGHFDEFTLNELTKSLSKQTKSESNKNWFWLTNAQAVSIIENVKAFGQYWSDAAALQYGTGVRAEELVLLKTADVQIQNGTAQIKIARIFDGKTLVRKVKTHKSEDYVHVPSFAMEALHRRIAEKEFLLFPCYDFKTLIAPKYQQYLTDFEKANKLWSIPNEKTDADDDEKSNGEYGFCAAYLPRLRKAASGIEGLNPKDVDSRTFRRTCARELILKYGFDRAAAVIRDDVDTLRAHYADLKSNDTSTER